MIDSPQIRPTIARTSSIVWQDAIPKLDAGSIPIARSRNPGDSTALASLTCLNPPHPPLRLKQAARTWDLALATVALHLHRDYPPLLRQRLHPSLHLVDRRQPAMDQH